MKSLKCVVGKTILNILGDLDSVFRCGFIYVENASWHMGAISETRSWVKKIKTIIW